MADQPDAVDAESPLLETTAPDAKSDAEHDAGHDNGPEAEAELKLTTAEQQPTELQNDAAIRRIPPEIRYRIGTYLDAKDTQALVQVDRDWRAGVEKLNWERISVTAGLDNVDQSTLVDRWRRLAKAVAERPELVGWVERLAFVPTLLAEESTIVLLRAFAPSIRGIALRDVCTPGGPAPACEAPHFGTALLDSLRVFPQLVEFSCKLHGNWSASLFRALRSMPRLERLAVIADGDDVSPIDALRPAPSLPKLQILSLDAPRAPRTAALLLAKATNLERLALQYNGTIIDRDLKDDPARYAVAVRQTLLNKTISRLELGPNCTDMVTVHAPPDWLPSLSILALEGKLRTDFAHAGQLKTLCIGIDDAGAPHYLATKPNASDTGVLAPWVIRYLDLHPHLTRLLFHEGRPYPRWYERAGHSEDYHCTTYVGKESGLVMWHVRADPNRIIEGLLTESGQLPLPRDPLKELVTGIADDGEGRVGADGWYDFTFFMGRALPKSLLQEIVGCRERGGLWRKGTRGLCLGEHEWRRLKDWRLEIARLEDAQKYGY